MEKLQTFVMAAEDDLASVRSSLLIVAQTGDASDLEVPRRNLARLKGASLAHEMPAIVDLCTECEELLDQFRAADKVSPGSAYAALDIIARIEAAVWDVPMQSEDFLSDIAGFIDASFEGLMPQKDAVEHFEEFEIDEETLDIFRSEADELLSNIAENLGVLSEFPADQNALWEVRRNAHTFKGAAGIVGLTDASETAHRMEDLLDKMVETRCEAVPEILGFLVASSKRLTAITSAKSFDDDGSLDRSYAAAMACLAASANAEKHVSEVPEVATHAPVRPDTARSTTTPIVRVSLDRLDELIKISRTLIMNRSAIEERIAELGLMQHQSADSLAMFADLFAAQKALTDEVQTKLLSIRMVKFGTLETRLGRNINVTCGDEGKKASLEIENGEFEIDTQDIDALIEPLLHLLKNAVVHGIESPDTRRLIGKPERGRITVNVGSKDGGIRVVVTDDGGGISPARLKEKALSSGIITEDQSVAMTDADAMELIFHRGLTTAGKIDLNAGRGVGMAIVKEAIEACGGSIHVRSEPQRGTTFTMLMPVRSHASAIEPPAPEPEQPESNAAPLVLIVDDSPSIRRQSTKLVEQAGLRVITANNGADALELLLSGDWEPDLILSDVEMPQIDGWGLLEYVKTDDNFGHFPVVMITSLDAEQHRQRAMELGASDYLIKPLKEHDLARVIKNVIYSKAAE
ncbi:MAG: response regulator [Pyrinomonadaceae bacterium]